MSRINHAANCRRLAAEVDALIAPLATVIAEHARRQAETAAARYERLMRELEQVPAGSARYHELYAQATAAKVEADRERSTARLERSKR